MNLDTYLSAPDAPSSARLASDIGVQAAQLRQWRYSYGGRKPSPESSVAIERATSGAVRRWDLRPEDWHLIWPELIGAEGAPEAKPEASDAR